MYSVLTYATHDEGSLQALRRAVPGLVVGGWQQPWCGLADKLRFVLAQARAAPDDHILIFLDGFDTEARLPPEVAVERFLRLGAPVLVSAASGGEASMPQLLVRRAFGCAGPWCANTGLYMGRSWALRQLLAVALEQESSDDQRAFELARRLLPGLVRVDSDCVVFRNLPRGEEREDTAVFVGRNARQTGSAALRQLRHFSRLLGPDALLALLALSLGLCWRWLRWPWPHWLLPLVVAALCFWGVSQQQQELLFLLALFALAAP
jgi:hypothetical protein